MLYHSDRGGQYGSEAFQRRPADQGIFCSLNWAGKVWDNVAVNSFFSSMKTERSSRKIYRTRDEARADLFDYPYRPRIPPTSQALDARLRASGSLRGGDAGS